MITISPHVSRRTSITLLASMAAGGVLGQAPAAASDAKRALCIGNARYASRPLRNPLNDARSVGSALKDLGFEVTTLLDATLADMRSAFRAFFEASKEAQTAFIFYAGHGFEVNGTNYLIPVDSDPGSITTSDMAQVAFSLRTITSELERSRVKVRVVVIDACRDTPKRGATLGMQQMTAKGTLLAFSTSPGFLAEDSMAGTRNSNSPYTFALTESLRNRDLTLKEMFNRAHNTVAALTQERQIPWVHDGMTGDVRLFDSKTTMNAAVLDSSRLATLPRPQGGRGGDKPPTLEDDTALPPLQKDAAGKYIDAKAQLMRRYGSVDPQWANYAISQCDTLKVKLYIDAGISFGILASNSNNKLLYPIANKSDNLSGLIALLVSARIDLNEIGTFYGVFNTFKGFPPRMHEIGQKYDVSGVSGTGVYTLAGQALPIAVWCNNRPAVEALIAAGVSVDNAVTGYANRENPTNGMVKISTVRQEMVLAGMSDLLPTR